MKLLPRILLVAVIGSGVAGAAYFGIRTGVDKANPDVMGPGGSASPDSRPAPKPSGTFAVTIERSKLPQAPVAGLSDQGEVLLQGEVGEFDYYKGSEAKHLKTKGGNLRYLLSPSGALKEYASEKITSGSSPLVYPFNEAADRPMFFGNGEVAVARKNVSLAKDFKKPSGDFYVLSRETQFYTDKGRPPGVEDVGTVASGNPQMSGLPQQYFNMPSKYKQWFVSPEALTVLATDDKDTVLVSTRKGSRSKGTEKLIKVTESAHEEYPSPDGYVNVLRAAITGDKIAATFGVVGGKLPFRSFVLDGKAWKELPVPDGTECTFVQQILTDGSILGYATNGDGKGMKHVIWKGDAVAVLDDQQGWPKGGEVSLVTRANRSGDIGIRNITDSTSGTSDHYLIHIKL